MHASKLQNPLNLILNKNLLTVYEYFIFNLKSEFSNNP